MKFLYVFLLFILPVMWILIHLSPWIQIQRYKMKGKAEFNRHKPLFFRRKLYFLELFFLMRANLSGLGSDLKIMFFFFIFKICFEINLVILLTWIRTGTGNGPGFIKFSNNKFLNKMKTGNILYGSFTSRLSQNVM